HAARIESEDSYRSGLQVSPAAQPAAQTLPAKAHRVPAPPMLSRLCTSSVMPNSVVCSFGVHH
ncbi:hypothetical protein L195_g037219, partial [Trifolium pratense]